ncbi:MAG: ferredoxin [Prosthecobacter sp.]|nr:ferredoxin [Prosthecobacter sp.]
MKHQSSNPKLEKCIQECLQCHHICLEMAMNHCLQAGGQHTEPTHFRLMLNCAEICQTSANFMLSGSDLHHLTCQVCAEVCKRCADSCASVGEMDECVQACRSCAETCAQMAG